MGNALESVSTLCQQCGCNPSSLTKPPVTSFLNVKKKQNFNLETQKTPQKVEEHHMNSLSNVSTLDNPSHLSSAKSYGKNLLSFEETIRPRKLTAQDFVLERPLGKGSVGRVLLVRRVNGLELLAMKIMKKSDLLRDQLYENIILEKHILQINNHPFIVHLKHSFQSKTKLYLIMEYLSGGDLFALIRRYRKFSELQTRFYAAEVLLALEYLHNEMHIIYRDLKPENILLSAEGHVKLTDFGLSKQSEKAYTFAGTPEYLAPEIFLAKGYTKAVDYWSLGVLIYEMLVGKPPFTSDVRNISQIEKLILINKPEYPSNLTEDAIDLIQKLLETNPKKRIQNDEIKEHPFFKTINWDEIKNLKVEAPIPVERIRARKSNKLQNSLVDENEENATGEFAYLPGISFNEMIE